MGGLWDSRWRVVVVVVVVVVVEVVVVGSGPVGGELKQKMILD